jgi:hypothetical protein
LAWKLAIPATCLAVAGQLAFSSSAAATRTVTTAGHAAAVSSNKSNLLDCNLTVIKRLCTDPHGKPYDGYLGRFRDPKTGAYVGHDEPSVKFISSQAGSGNTMTYGMKLSKDPSKAPTASGSVTHYGELSVAPWFGLPICDPQSYPQNGCTPLSDTNSGSASDPAAAGSALMELQFYPPGFTPFIDSTSCSKTKWCAALTIDSFECNFNFVTCNNNCIEPVNFSFMQTNGVPPGPPAPQDTTRATLFGNANTLKMNPGDVLKVSISDVQDNGTPNGGLKASVADLTTGQTGFMVASAANGFQNTSMADCSGTPFSFHAEYNTAKKRNQVPWAALEAGVLMEQEIGHGESCSSVTHKLGVSATFSDGSSYSDPNIFQTCNGGTEGKGKTGEGPCNPTTGVCQHARTQGRHGPVACPSNKSNSGQLCEFSDAFCLPKGSRAVMIDGNPATESARVAICYQTAFQNGDLDFDGNSYRADWPNGKSNRPTSIRYVGPFTNGKPYPSIQFETNTAGSSRLCNLANGHNCTAPPVSARFYPFWTLNRSQTVPSLAKRGACIWNFGNVSGTTFRNFGKTAEYGKPNLARFAGTLISPVRANPQFGKGCKSINPFS